MTTSPPAPVPARGSDRRAGRERRASGQLHAPVIPRPHLMRGLGLYAALFGGVLMLLLIAVILEDMALRDSLRIQANRDAEAVATEVEAAVAVRIAAARAFNGLYADGPAARMAGDAGRFHRLLPAITSPAPLFDRVVVGDRRHAFVHDTTLTVATGAVRVRGSPALPAVTAQLLSMVARDTAAAPPLRPPRVEQVQGMPGTVAIVVPLAVDTVSPATFVGVVRIASLASHSINDEAPRRIRMIVLAGGDTIFGHGEADEGSVRTAAALANVHAAQPWRIEVMHEDTAPGVRATLWLLGGSAVVFLVLGLARERRQADHVAERSAELERLSTELLRSNRMKSEFLANVSHELRTPLNAIVGFVELLRDGVYGELSPRQTNPVERIAGSATHLRHLVDQVLDIAKMAAGRLEVHLESVVLRPFVLNVASELESLAADKGIVLSLTVGSSLPRVRTDPSHLRQILVNLVGNAIKYTPAGGAVAIRTRLVGGPPGVSWRAPTPPPGSMHLPASASLPTVPTVEEEPAPPTLAARSPDPSRPWIAVQVSDTGIGIAPADHERIFEEFEQVNAGPRGESMQRGTGLGLPISRRLARLLGGDVSVESGLGKGATFTLWLPLEASVSGKGL